MAYLIGEVLVFLAAAALIGGGMAWMLQGLRACARERQLTAQVQEARSGRAAAEAAAQALTSSLNDLRAEMERETGRLQARVAELETLQAAARPSASPSGLPRKVLQACWRFSLQAALRVAHVITRAIRRLFP